KAIRHDHGIRKVRLGNAPISLGQIHHYDTHVLLARQPLQIATQARFRAAQHHIEYLMVLQIHQRGGVALLAAKEMLINAQHLGAGPARELRDALLYKRLVPALDRGAADPVGTSQLVLAHTPVVGFEDFQAVRLGSTTPRPNAREAVAEIAIAVGAVVLGHTQVQHHQLIALAGVLERTLVRRFNPYRPLLAMYAHQALGRPGPDMNLSATLHPINHYISDS